MTAMKQVLLSTALLAGAGLVTGQASALDLVRLNVNGTLGDGSLSVHAPYDFAPFAGWIEVDLDSPFSTGDNTAYALTDWDVTVQPPGIDPPLQQLADAETYDDGVIVLVRSSDKFSLTIDEDIDDPGSGAIEDRTLRLIFDVGLDITSATTLSDVLAAPGFGTSATFDAASSLLQLTTSQGPIPVADATLQIPEPTAVSLLMLGGMCLARRR